MREDNSSKKHKTTIRILIAVVAVLIVFIAYFFVAVPQIENYKVNQQNLGADNVIGAILQGIQTNGYVGMPISDNETINLVPVEACAQIVAAQAENAQQASN